MKTYKHLFFDLDRTLWDFDKNAEETFRHIYAKYGLQDRGVGSLEAFRNVYEEHNNLLWSYYRKGEIKKPALNVRRFEMSLNDFGIKDTLLACDIANDYITVDPDRVYLFPHALEILQYLAPNYHIHIITNGFDEVQFPKIAISGMKKYLDKVITSEDAGCKKPESDIFLYALERTSARVEESIMIGDDLEVDIQGAKSVGMDQVFVNYKGLRHDEEVTFEVNSLGELKELF
jgi:putative hydrolase of the HAD superfamily